MNTFTFENTKEATGYAITEKNNHQPCFYKINSRVDYHVLYNDCDCWSLTHGSPFFKYIELARPIGERKEDHTIDGLTTYALAPVRQYDDQEAELATHYSTNNNCFYIQESHHESFAMVLDDVGRWIYSDCTTNAELNGDEFWKLDGKQIIEPVTVPEFPSDFYQSDNPQVIEPWVGDHITDKPTREQQLSKASEALREDYDKGMRKCVQDIARLVGLSFGSNIGYDNLANVVDQAINGTSEQQESACPGVDSGFNASAYEESCKRFEDDEDKPVFTQEMERKGELPPVGCEVGYNTASRGDIVGVVTGYRTWKSLNTLADNCDYRVFVTFEHNERLLKDVWPIDNRSDKEKLKDEIYKQIVTPHIPDTYLDDVIDSLVNAGKFTITLKD